MKARMYLRIASVLTFLHAILHTIGGVFGKAAPGIQETTLAVMKANTFHILGVTRSYWDFERGMGLAVSIFLTIEAVVFWQLSALAKNDGARLRPMLGAFVVTYLAMAVNSYFYFFAAPVIAEIAIAIFLGLAFLAAKPAAVQTS
ncbi:MAG TPA: hypothetical protein VLX32_14090 [Candidatus Acidoferrum sp.]|nr:hypothetical protein [Candidatus Acidoferrum sp.]